MELQKLIEGYSNFRERYYGSSNTLYRNLSEQGQSPSAIIVACCDSRVDPAIILDCDPGELFVIRNVANLIPPYENDRHYHGTSAALEFGVCVLNIPHIIVLGHSQCGGIKALLEQSTDNPESFIAKWMELASCYADRKTKHSDLSVQERADRCGKQSLLGSLNHLMTFPWVQERVDAKTLSLHAWYFNLQDGMIDAFDEKKQDFVPLK